MPERLVRVERDDHDVVTLTFHNPESRNAMTQAMGEAFAGEVKTLAADASVRAVVLTGSAEGRAFSAGGDLGMIGGRASEASGSGAASVRDTMRGFYGLFLTLRDLPCPTVAAINGHAVGAGLCVALACDLRVASSEAKLSLNFARLGLHPGMGATWTLPRIVGPERAAELLYTGRTLLGEEAWRIGLVTRAVAPDAVLEEARALAREIATSGPQAVRGIKQALARSAISELPAQLDFEAARQAECFESEDVKEGLAAAREKRPPRFRGR